MNENFNLIDQINYLNIILLILVQKSIFSFYNRIFYTNFIDKKMIKNNVAEILKLDGLFLEEIKLKGWVRTFRSNRFIALNDGSTIHNIQCVIDFENTPEETLKRINTGAAIFIKGTLAESQGRGQSVEIQVSEIEILGDSNPDEYPIQPKKHSFEFLRENAHLRVRTNTLVQ